MDIITIPEKEEVESVSIAEGEHVIGEFIGDENGPTLVVIGSIHGNETSGLIAMRKVAPEIENLADRLKGRVYLIAGNTRAINEGVRYIDADLNRHWTIETVERNMPGSTISTNRAEDIEQRELLEILEGVFRSAKNEVYVLDLHSTSSDSSPFAMIGDTLRNREFARKFPATVLLGIEEQLDSTVLEYINNVGAITLGFEAGQHTTQAAVDNQEALMWLALLNTKILPSNRAIRRRHERVLRNAMGDAKIIEIRYRHGITPEDGFKMELGYKNFQPVRKGELLANDRHGEIKARETSLILMPLYQDQGDDGFFLGREINQFWLKLSRILRKMRLGAIMHFLPGVRKHQTDDNTLIVNTRIARILPLQIFHLLGFRKRRWRNEKLVVSRRKHDTISPFRRNGTAS